MFDLTLDGVDAVDLEGAAFHRGRRRLGDNT